MTTLPFEGYGQRDLRLAMIGMVAGNGHPYSWSAIFNGYDEAAMAQCPYPVIPEYLGRQPKDALGIPGARVTHLWTDDPDDAPRVAQAARIPHVVQRPENVIGAVDAAIIATDIGQEHAARCRPFVEAGVPVFVDKPLVDNAADLAVFRAWSAEGRAVMTSSALAYAKEFAPYRASTADLGALRFALATTTKSWERYGIHALSALYPIVGPGFVSARNTGSPERNIVHLKHARGLDAVIVATHDLYGGFGRIELCGTHASAHAQLHDTFYAFKAQLVDFVRYLRTGAPSTPWAETEELMKLVIAGIVSRSEDGREVALDEIP